MVYSGQEASIPAVDAAGAVPSARKRAFPNLASSPDNTEAVTAACKSELEAAGIQTYVFGGLYGQSEVPSKCVGHLSGWSFKRAWYYWVATGPGIPPEIAERLHATHGREVRVEGHCGCPSPLEWAHGFAIGSYHVDTNDGLKALADTLASIWDDRPVKIIDAPSVSPAGDFPKENGPIRLATTTGGE